MMARVHRLISLALCAAMLFSLCAFLVPAAAEDVTSGRFRSTNKSNLHLNVDWTLLAADQTSAEVKFDVIVSYYSLAIAEREGTLTVGGQVFAFSTNSIRETTIQYRETTLASFVITVPVSDGKIAADVDCAWNSKVTYSKVYYEYLTVTETLECTVPAAMLSGEISAIPADVTSGRLRSTNDSYLHLIVDWELLSATHTEAEVKFTIIASYYKLSLGDRIGTLTVGDQIYEFSSASIKSSTTKYRETTLAVITASVPVRNDCLELNVLCAWNAMVTYSSVYYDYLYITDSVLCVIPESMLPEDTGFVYGDVSGDRVVDSIDVVLFRRYFGALDYATGISPIEIFEGADANGDGVISTADLLLIRRYLAEFDYTTGKSSVILGKR